jgi:hypothetical protein
MPAVLWCSGLRSRPTEDRSRSLGDVICLIEKPFSQALNVGPSMVSIWSTRAPSTTFTDRSSSCSCVRTSLPLGSHSVAAAHRLLRQFGGRGQCRVRLCEGDANSREPFAWDNGAYRGPVSTRTDLAYRQICGWPRSGDCRRTSLPEQWHFHFRGGTMMSTGFMLKGVHFRSPGGVIARTRRLLTDA